MDSPCNAMCVYLDCIVLVLVLVLGVTVVTTVW